MHVVRKEHEKPAGPLPGPVEERGRVEDPRRNVGLAEADPVVHHGVDGDEVPTVFGNPARRGVEVMRAAWAIVSMHPAMITGVGVPISAPLAPTGLFCCPASMARPDHRAFPIRFPGPMKVRSARSAGEFIRRCRR